MTKIEMLYEGNLYKGFKMSGHAEYNKGGPDIICASLSAVSQMTVNGILDATGCYAEETIKESDVVEGTLHFEVELLDEWTGIALSVIVQQMFKSFVLYIEMLSEMYPENVILIERSEEE